MHTYFIVNPAAGNGKAKHIIPEIEEWMERRNLPYTIYLTRKKGDGEAYVKREAKKQKEGARFFACGGDGTLHEVVNGLSGTEGMEAGLFPLGSGNDFVRNFTHRENFLSLQAQLAGRTEKVDLLRIHARKGINMINIGFDCDVVAKAAQWKKKTFVRGALAYFLAVGSMFLRPMGKKMSFYLEDGDVKQGEYLLCTIANGSFCGGAFCSSPYARINDGRMDAALIGKVSRGMFLRLLPSYRKGNYLEKMEGRKQLDYFTCKTLEIQTKSPLRVSVDGEIYPFRHLKIGIEEKALSFIIPQGSEISEKNCKGNVRRNRIWKE